MSVFIFRQSHSGAGNLDLPSTYIGNQARPTEGPCVTPHYLCPASPLGLQYDYPTFWFIALFICTFLKCRIHDK